MGIAIMSDDGHEEIFTESTMGRFLDMMAARDPERDFIVYPDRDLRFSYRDFNNRATNLAKGLLAIGMKPGDHIGVWARNVPDWLTYFFGAAKAGIVPVTINTYYKSHELEYVVQQSDMKALAMVDGYKGGNYSYIDILYGIAPELRDVSSFTRRVKSPRFPVLEHVIYMGPEKHRGMHNTNELIALGAHTDDAALARAAAGVRNGDMINMQYTSGTTGYPKGVMLTHRNLLNNGFYIGERQKMTAIDRVCLPVPLFHCFGITLGIMAILTHGATAVLLEQFDPLEALAAVEKERCTALYGVPTMFISEMTHPLFDKFDLSSLRTGIMAGSPCPIEWMEKAIRLMNMREITITYGLTECSPAFTMTSVDDAIERKVSTVGTGMPHCEVRVIDPDTGADSPVGVPGELCCRGYNVMKGYYKMPEETAKAIDRDGFMHSGDLGTVDADGYYRITGRLKDMIIRGGENVYPREIEEFLYKMPGVQDVQVVGAPDAKYGETVAAFVILHSPTADVVRTHLAVQLDLPAGALGAARAEKESMADLEPLASFAVGDRVIAAGDVEAALVGKMPGIASVRLMRAGDAGPVAVFDPLLIEPEDIQDFCRARIAPYKVPQYVWIVPEFPLTTSGKIQKFKLRETARERINTVHGAKL